MRDNVFSLKIKYSTMAETAFIAYFGNSTIRWILSSLLGSGSVVTGVAVLIPYGFLAVCLAMNPRRAFKPDFVLLYLFVLAFFAITYLIHPEYSYYYAREEYGVWGHVLNPYRGIYAYLFVRLMESPDQIRKCVKTSGWIVYPYAANRIITASARGYWKGFAMGGGTSIEMSYSVAFGYELLLFVLFFLFDALVYKKKTDMIGAAAGLFMILIAGSRGPFLFVAELIIIYFVLWFNNTRKKIIAILLTALGGLIIYNYGFLILNVISTVLARYGFSSRFLKKTLAGTITTDSGRSIIWNSAIQMIKENPFGYGAMGSRHRIARLIYTGYPHSIVLEFLIDYGVFLGSALIVFFMLFSFHLIFRSGNKWKNAFIPMFCSACSLFLSLTYWSIPEYWACLAIGYQYLHSGKKKEARITIEGDNNEQ